MSSIGTTPVHFNLLKSQPLFSMPSSETYREAFPGSKIPHISYGLPFPEACAKHVPRTVNASRVYIIASKTLSTNTDAFQRLETALDGKVVGKRIGMTPHTLWSECLEVTAEARRLAADLIITLGAGSLTDAAKIVSLVVLFFIHATPFEATNLSRLSPTMPLQPQISMASLVAMTGPPLATISKLRQSPSFQFLRPCPAANITSWPEVQKTARSRNMASTKALSDRP